MLSEKKVATERVASPQVGQGAIEFWSGDALLRMNETPYFVEFHARWQQLAVHGTPRLKALLDNAPDMVRRHMQLVLQIPDDFIFVHEGDRAKALLGRDACGVLRSEIPTAAAKEITWLLKAAAKHLHPVYFRFSTPREHGMLHVEELALPVVSDDTHKAKFLVCLVDKWDNHSSLLEKVFEQEHLGLMAATLAPQTVGTASDGKIIKMNARAREVLKVPPGASKLQYIREIAPWLRDHMKWERVNTQTRDGRTRIVYEDAAGQCFAMTIEKMDRYMIFVIGTANQGNDAGTAKVIFPKAITSVS